MVSLTWLEIRKRILRFDELSMGLSEEYELFRKGLIPLDSRQRTEYLASIDLLQKAVANVRMAIVRAVHKHEAPEARQRSCGSPPPTRKNPVNGP